MIRTAVLAAILSASLAAGPAGAQPANVQGEGGCLELPSEIGWSVAVDGILDRRTIHVTTGQPDGTVRTERQQVYFLVPENPDSCFVDDDGEETAFSYVHVYSTDEDVMMQLADRVGGEVRITGYGFAGHSMFHHAPLVLEALEIQSLETAPQPEGY